MSAVDAGLEVKVWHVWPEEVLEAATAAAWDVARKFEGAVDFDDLHQEAHLYVATHPELVRKRLGKPAWVRRMVRDELTRRAVLELRRQSEPLEVPVG